MVFKLWLFSLLYVLAFGALCGYSGGHPELSPVLSAAAVSAVFGGLYVVLWASLALWFVIMTAEISRA